MSQVLTFIRNLKFYIQTHHNMRSVYLHNKGLGTPINQFFHFRSRAADKGSKYLIHIHFSIKKVNNYFEFFSEPIWSTKNSVDFLHSTAIFDMNMGPFTIKLPKLPPRVDRYMSLICTNEEHFMESYGLAPTG